MKGGHLPVSNEFNICVTRLRQLHSRLKKNKELLRDYDNVIKDQVKSEIIEAVPENDENQTQTHFLSHVSVIRTDRETTKIRVGFEGSAKTDNSTAFIKKCLEKGPNLVPHLFDVVIKFRGYPIAVVADFEKAFHLIQIHPDDRGMLRFLASTINHHLAKYEESEPAVTSLLSSSLYVDDLSVS